MRVHRLHLITEKTLTELIKQKVEDAAKDARRKELNRCVELVAQLMHQIEAKTPPNKILGKEISIKSLLSAIALLKETSNG